MKKLSFKNTFLLLIIGLSWLGLSAVGETRASFVDTETSSGNTFTAATLDFSLSSPGNFSSSVTPTQSSSRNISVVNNGSLGFQYTVQASNFSGDSALCNALNLDANVDGGVSEYNGVLNSFSTGSIVFGLPEDWVFTVSLTSNDSSLQNKTCNFDFVFNGGQIGSSGFSDQETISNSVTSGTWVVPLNTWVQTTQADFDAGVKTSVTTNSSGTANLSYSTATTGITSTGSTTYPTSTVGTTSVLGSTAETQGNVSAQKITVPTGGGTIQSVTIYWGAVSRAGSVRFAFYTDSGGNPNALVSGSDTGIVAVGTDQAGKWQTISYGTPFYLSAGTYWLARQATDPVDGKGPKRNYASTPAGPGRRVHTQAWGAFPNPFGTINTSDTLNESQYTTYVQIEGYAKATKVTLSNNADITSLSFYSHATGNFRLAIYSNSSGPSSKQWESASTAATVGWNTINISSGTPTSLPLNAGTYWLAWQWDSANSGPSYTAGSSGDGNYISQAYGSFPVTWSGGTSTNEKWSIYASYTTYTITGTLESQSFDSVKMTRWQSLEWDETLPSGNTDITLEVATSSDNSIWSPWQLSSNDVSIGIDLTSLPETRYIKWKATLTTTNNNETPQLHEVRVKYYPGAASEHIVLNEFLPNPSGTNPDYGFDFGEDNDLMPKGEWVEIYNKAGGKAVDLAGWYIKDRDGNTKSITTLNTNTGSTVIGANGSGDEWLVVYMNGEMFNNDGDVVELYDTLDNLIDSYSYKGDAPGNKSYARIPDGTGDWIDPVPTPGGPNREESIDPAIPTPDTNSQESQQSELSPTTTPTPTSELTPTPEVTPTVESTPTIEPTSTPTEIPSTPTPTLESTVIPTETPTPTIETTMTPTPTGGSEE